MVLPGFDTAGSKAKAILDLIGSDADDTLDTDESDEYALNAAFSLRILREENVARVYPSAALLALCAFSAQRPGENNYY